MVKLCECGCGQPAPLAQRSSRRKGIKRGEALRFVAQHHAKVPLEVRFWQKVDKSGDCWLWTAAKFKHGYGACWVETNQRHAHRVAFELAYGPIPKGMEVCHRCDVKLCVRPDHLFLGTHQENIDDKERKGRGLKGEGVRTSKLTEDQVREMRRLHSPGQKNLYELAAKFGVAHDTVAQICQGRSWRHVT